MSDSEFQQCKACCEEKPLHDFYQSSKRRFKVCKQCISVKNHQKYQKQPTGFAKLADDAKRIIFEAIENKKSYKEVSKLSGVPYTSLLYWKKRNYILA